MARPILAPHAERDTSATESIVLDFDGLEQILELEAIERRLARQRALDRPRREDASTVCTPR